MLNWRATVAGAMALSGSVLILPVAAAPTTGPVAAAPSQIATGRPPSFDDIDVASQPPPQFPASRQPSTVPTVTTIAPLPSALLAGPATLAVAGWISWRIRRRGGRI